MLRHKRKLFVIFSILSSTAFSAVSEESRLLEELTGKKSAVRKEDAALKASVAQSPAQIILKQAHDSFKLRQYRQALEQYDRVITHYGQTSEAMLAFKGKAELYTEMGLEAPAQLNRRLADQASKKITQ